MKISFQPIFNIAFTLVLIFLGISIVFVRGEIDTVRTTSENDYEGAGKAYSVMSDTIKLHEKVIITLFCKEYPSDKGCLPANK